MLHKIWDIIDELRRENNELKKDISHDSRVHQEYDDKYIAKINELEQENNELKINLELKDQELLEEWKENKKLRTKLNERVSCKDYESEGREYFSHNPSSNKVSFFMFDDDYINTYDIDESMEICTIYNDNM
jgi:seryl-tRNA synthetase